MCEVFKPVIITRPRDAKKKKKSSNERTKM